MENNQIPSTYYDDIIDEFNDTPVVATDFVQSKFEYLENRPKRTTFIVKLTQDDYSTSKN